MRIAAALATVSALILAAGCGGGDDEGPASTAAPAPTLEKVGDFREPIFLAEPPSGDGTVYVVERGGTVRTVAPDGAVGAKPVLDLSDDVETEGEGGLFSIAFAPDDSRVFVSYSAPGRLAVERFDWDAETGEADLRSRRELLSIPHPKSDPLGRATHVRTRRGALPRNRGGRPGLPDPRPRARSSQPAWEAPAARTADGRSRGGRARPAEPLALLV